jgi:hypothetical protein
LLIPGDSIPVNNFSTDSLRWLNNAQALEDSAQFIANFRWGGIDLSAPKNKWIYYGVSHDMLSSQGVELS